MFGLVRTNNIQTINNSEMMISEVTFGKDGTTWFVTVERADWYDDMYGQSHRTWDVDTTEFTNQNKAREYFEMICAQEREMWWKVELDTELYG